MGRSLTHKILQEHRVSGDLRPGEEVSVRIDQTLTQDATGTLAFLEFEAMGVPRVRVKRAVSYVDHNMLQADFMNADDHLFLQSAAAKFGALFSRPGNGICHQVHLERFSAPGETLLGSDSHTPTSGGAGMLAVGAGGLEVAAAMAGRPFVFEMPRVLGVRLTGRLGPWVASKDIILHLLGKLTVKGGTGRIMEYHGPGVEGLSVPERATVTNMGAELGATTSIFPSDQNTRAYLEAQGRGRDWRPLAPDGDAGYDERVEVDLPNLEPMVARPHSPDNVAPVSEVAGTKVHQVCIGSCTNSSYMDLATAARILRGRKVHSGISLTVTPGSRQVLEMAARDGFLADFVAAGARILESACGPCIGMGQAPPTGGVSVRTFNRNFEGRSGTAKDSVYLVSPAIAAATALTGELTDPRDLGLDSFEVPLPREFRADDSMILPPSPAPEGVEIVRGPNIRPLPRLEPPPKTLRGRVLLKVGDNISTDHIMPAGARLLPLRSNIPALAEHVFERVDPAFAKRAREAGGGFVVGGENYGQGSSREHAALCPAVLGVRAVLAKSFARIHRTNLVYFGILPLTFVEGDSCGDLGPGAELEIPDTREVKRSEVLRVHDRTGGKVFRVRHGLSPRLADIYLAGGLLNHARNVGEET